MNPPILLRNETKNYMACDKCNEYSRSRCETCFGTGLVCTSCYNSGVIIQDHKNCDCGMDYQRAIFFERMSFRMQKLITLDRKFMSETKTEWNSQKLDGLAKEGYCKSNEGVIYSRFVFLKMLPQQFAQYRYTQAKKLNNSPAFLGQHLHLIKPGIIYISAPETNKEEYVKAVNTLIAKNPDAVLVIMGASNNLTNYLYPILPIITNNLSHPMLIFANLEWYLANAPLNMHVVDGIVEDNGTKWVVRDVAPLIKVKESK